MTSVLGLTFLQNIQDGNYDAVLAVVQNRTVNLDERDENGQTFLMEACKMGNTQIVELLLDQEDVNIHAVDNDNWTALLNAAKEGHTEIVHMLCERGAFIEHTDMGGWTALMWGCYKGRLGVVHELLERGANPNVKGEFFVSCLTWAAGRGHTDIVEALLAHGAKVNTADKYGTTPIIWASRRGHRDIVDMLVAEGANIDNAGMNSWTALIIAAKGGYVDVVGILLDQHPNTNAVDKDGYTALTWAAKDGHYEIANMLVHHGAYINLLDRNGDSILIHAVKGGNVELVKLLLKKYADIDVIGVGEKTALYWAVDKNQFASAKMLLAYNANMEIANKDGDTPLLRAVRSRNLDMVRILLDKGAKVSATDRRGDTALHICLRAQSKRIAEQLLRNPKDGRLLYRPNRQGETPYQIDSTHQRSILSQILGGKHLNAEDESWSGYDLYSSTIADVLSEPSLHTPMTVGLYAKWGSGKSFLIEKLVKEMQNFTKHNIDLSFEFTTLQFFGFFLVSLVIGLILGVLVRWEIGLGIGVGLLLIEYAFLGLVWFGANRWEWGWAETLARRLASDLQLLKLLMQVIFCNEPDPPSRDIVAVKFMFTNNARLASVVGEKSITTMVATLCEALERKYGRLVTRLYTVFMPVKASRHGRYKTLCAVPYFVIFLFILTCILAIGLMLASFGVTKFITLSDMPFSSVTITLMVIVSLALLGNLYTWGNMVVSLAVPAKKRIHRIGNELETLKMEGFVQNLKKEVELLGKMTLCLDAFLNIHTRLVVIVDGLDSCDQEKLLQVLDTVNMLFNDMKPFITILAVDPHVIIKGIEHNLQGLFRDSSITGHDYLRNIVHLPFFIQSQVLRPKQRNIDPNVELISSEVNLKGIHRHDSVPEDYSRHRTKNMFENHRTLPEMTLRQDSRVPQQQALENNTYFSDVNPRSLKRLMNIVAVTGRLLRALNVEFNWLKLAAWVNLTEQWPYRISWMILEVEDNSEDLEESTSLKVLYERVVHKIPVSKVIDPLLEIDRNPQKLEVFLTSCQPTLTIANIKTFLPCTINIDPYLRKLIREMMDNNETLSHDYTMNVASNLGLPTGLSGPESLVANWPYNPRSTPMRLQQLHTPSSINVSPMGVASNFMPPPGMPGMPGVNYMGRMSSLILQHQMAVNAGAAAGTGTGASPFTPRSSIDVNPRLPRLSVMTVSDVCHMITDIDGITSSALNRYVTIIRENNINGAVLLQCDLTELKPVMKMTFGDWELFRRYVEAMRERDYTEPTASYTDHGPQFTQVAPGGSGKNGSHIANPRPRHIEVKPQNTTPTNVSRHVSTDSVLTASDGFSADEAKEILKSASKKSLKKQASFVGLVMMESQALKQAIVDVGLDETDQEVELHELDVSTTSTPRGSSRRSSFGINERHVQLDEREEDTESCTSIPRAVFTIDSRTAFDNMRANTNTTGLSNSGSPRTPRDFTPVDVVTPDDRDNNSVASFHSSHEHLALRKLAQSDDVGSPSAFRVPPFGFSQPSSRSSSRGSKIHGHKPAPNHVDNHSDIVVDMDALSQLNSQKDSDLDTLL